LIVAARGRIINLYEQSCCRGMTDRSARQLVVAHYHLRPGGVRRVIETALPPLAATGRFDRITLATGEGPEAAWLSRLRGALGGLPLQMEVRPEFLYWSEIAPVGEDFAAELGRTTTDLLVRCGGEDAVLWAHNLALGRNAPLAGAWTKAVAETGATFLLHHHDFFFDNRWIRWPEMQAAGLSSLDAAAGAVFPDGRRTAHLAINRADHQLLSAGFGARALWLPNPVTAPRHAVAGVREARAWLAARTGSDAPYWLLPCRLLRRKNMAEALLLVRWLRPGARLVTTGGPTSADEQPYAERLREAAHQHRWPLQLAALAGQDDAPPVSALIAGAEAVVLTSLQEGFGLPYLEAASAARPLVARALPNVLPDLIDMGLRAPTVYREIMVPRDLFDRAGERTRQRALWSRWRSALPTGAQSLAGEPPVLAADDALVPFSRLTLTAQEEVLAHADARLQTALDEANPDLASWPRGAEEWPASGFGDEAAAALSPERFAENFLAAMEAADNAPACSGDAPQKVFDAFLKDRLRGDNLYPLVFDPVT
jgi:glycosyltransferase involved in cell wall biosynthesis